jgi:cytochrome oxidase Cu insertion factor (SCO1/SenC/PrrC family)
MILVLVAVWREDLLRDLRAAWSYGFGRLLVVLAGAGLLAGCAWATGKVRLGLSGDGSIVTDTVVPPEALSIEAPRLVLTDQHGASFDLRAMRGHTVLVTFAYAHCGSVCPTLVHEAKAARSDAGRPDVPLIVVTLDPWRDVVARLPAIVATWELGPADRVLSGAVAEVNAALDSWGVQRLRDPATGEIDHIPLVLVVDAQGRVAWRTGGDVRALAQVLADR